MSDDLVKRLSVLREFLHGAGPLDGRWFGDVHRPAFWWRMRLNSIDHAIDRIEALEAENERLKLAIATHGAEACGSLRGYHEQDGKRLWIALRNALKGECDE